MKIVVRCCVCHKTKNALGWTDASTATAPDVTFSHGYCPRCVEEEFARIAGFQKVRNMVAVS